MAEEERDRLRDSMHVEQQRAEDAVQRERMAVERQNAAAERVCEATERQREAQSALTIAEADR
jgi:hypothetical protein